jgi:hypothetical protein
MARQPNGRGKRVVFDEETWRGLDFLMREQMKSFDEISAEAYRDLLRKYGRPENLKAALNESLRASDQGESKARQPRPRATTRKKMKCAGRDAGRPVQTCRLLVIARQVGSNIGVVVTTPCANHSWT